MFIKALSFRGIWDPRSGRLTEGIPWWSARGKFETAPVVSFRRQATRNRREVRSGRKLKRFNLPRPAHGGGLSRLPLSLTLEMTSSIKPFAIYTRLRVASNKCMAGRPILWRTCALPAKIRAMPENEIPPARRVDFYSKFYQISKFYSNKLQMITFKISLK